MQKAIGMENRSIEYQLQQEDQLCFIRIPKTGSTTLSYLLASKFDAHEICPFLPGDISHISPDELAKYRLFRDHFDYDICNFLPKPPVYITMLRHPLARAVSFYEFCKGGQNHTSFDIYLQTAAQSDIKTFICSSDPTVRIRTSNLQTRQLALGLGSRHRNPFEPSELESQFSEMELLALAKEHLDHFKFVGLTERFQDSVLLLCYIFGWYPIVEYQNLRVSPHKRQRNPLDQATIEAILEANQLDLELYEYAQRIFEENFTQMVKTLTERYEPQQSQPALESASSELQDDSQRKTLITLLERHYEQRHAQLKLPLNRSLDFSFLKASFGSGWQRRNWTGPGTTSTLDFSLATDADLVIRLRVTNAVAPDVLDSLRLQVNGQEIPLQSLSRKETAGVFQGVIPKSVLRTDRSFTRLTLTVDRTLPFQTPDVALADERIVGVSLNRIQIFPLSARIGDDEYLHLAFHADDDFWVGTANFLLHHIQPTETLIAPGDFREPFVQQSFSYSSPIAAGTALIWVVIHKGLIETIDNSLIEQIKQTMKPVFANDVFVIFTARQDLQALSDQDPHLPTFWQAQSSPSPTRIWQKIKSKVVNHLTRNHSSQDEG
jgi:hypothetical protein